MTPDSFPASVKITRLAGLKSTEAFRGVVKTLGLELPCDDVILRGADSPLALPIDGVQVNGKQIGNRYTVQPMEGWDGTTSGGVTDEVLRRWRRFGESGAKLIFGGEAMAVRADGRANPNQLIISPENKTGLIRLREALCAAHGARFGSCDDLVLGFQLTHSGRFCKPWNKSKMEPRVAYRHPILDRRFGVTSDGQVWTDEELAVLVEDYVKAAEVAWEAGADFVDIKHCHGYLLHEFLGAHARPGKYGGAFENRTRLLREIIEGIRGSGNQIDIGVRLSAFDTVPYRPDPKQSSAGRLGPGIPEDYAGYLPYRYGFGVRVDDPVEGDLTETHALLRLCASLGVKIVNLSAGSPYYNPHIQRPAAYPPSDGYQPPEDPLVGVARQVRAAKALRSSAPKELVLVGTAYSYLQEFLPQVAQAVVRAGWIDTVGIGRAVLSYPRMLADALSQGELQSRFICRTFSDCTTGPRNGLISGCYPLDEYYSGKPEAKRLKEIKRAKGA